MRTEMSVPFLSLRVLETCAERAVEGLARARKS